MYKIIILISTVLAAQMFSQVSWALSGNKTQLDTVIVKLEQRAGNLPVKRVKAGRMLLNNELYSGIPQNLDLFRIFLFDFQYPATVYSQYFKSDLDKQKTAQRDPFTPQGPAIATMAVKSGVAVLSGIKGNKKIIICDTNNDQDFSNEQQLVYNILEGNNTQIESIPNILVTYEYKYQNKIIPRQITVKLLPFYKYMSFSDPVNQQLQIFLSLEHYPEGSFSYQNQSYKIALPTPIFLDGNYEQSFVIFGKASGEYYNIVPYIFKGDDITVQGKDIKITDISELGDWVKLVVANAEEKRKGFRVGERIEPFAFTTLDGQLITSNDNFKPFILLEFWGTWCGPCIAGIPALKALYRKNKQRLNLVSVAYDDDINKVKSFVKKNDLDWIHTFSKRKQTDKSSFIEKLRVDAYPTFILLDKNWNILARATSEKALTEIEEILNKGLK